MILRATVILLALLVSGCRLFSDSPLSDPLKEPLDRSLFGSWVSQEDNETAFAHIGTNDNGSAIVIAMAICKRDGRMDIMEFTGHTTKLGPHMYLNLRWVKPYEDKGYFFAGYAIRGNRLEYWLPDEKVFEKAVASGALHGEVSKPENWFPVVFLHAGQDELRQFVARSAADLRKNKQKFERLNLPKPRPSQHSRTKSKKIPDKPE